MLRRLSQWEATSIGSVAMGHEVGATSIQLALAGAIVANGGMRVKPSLDFGAAETSGALKSALHREARARDPPQTAITMRQMMEGVVLHGTGKQAILRGYTSGGRHHLGADLRFRQSFYTHHYNGFCLCPSRIRRS